MGGITDVVNSLASSFRFQVAPWFFPALLVAVGVMVYPSIAKRKIGRKARRLIENYGTTSGVQGDELRARITVLVKGDGPGLQMVLEEAEESGWTFLAMGDTKHLLAPPWALGQPLPPSLPVGWCSPVLSRPSNALQSSRAHGSRREVAAAPWAAAPTGPRGPRG